MTSPPDARLVAFAEELHRLHRAAKPLLLPNVWDPASARVLAAAGAPALATSSAAMAWSLGYPDGQQVPFSKIGTTLRRIAIAVDVPISADLEAGYIDQSGSIENTISALLRAGAVGVNLEDGDPARSELLIDAEDHADTIARARRAADQSGVRVFVNARTDVWWRQIGENATRADEVRRRLSLYSDAGADGVFAPGPATAEQLRHVIDGIDKPLNVMLMPGLPAWDQLQALGVGRVTLGADLLVNALDAAERNYRTLRDHGNPGPTLTAFEAAALGTLSQASRPA